MKIQYNVRCCFKAWLTAVVLVTASASSFAQKADLDTLLKKFDRYRVSHATEKIYAHLDQELYLTGEMMWFKLYVVDGSFHKPSDISKVAYVEILDKENKPVLQTKVPLQNGMCNGSLFLPASVGSGVYNMRVYTSWMKNFGPEFFFQKTVTIVNTFKKLEIEKTKPGPKPDAQFFPEGGNLVAGLKSTVAFRVINSTGNGIGFTGHLISGSNDTIRNFRPQKFGMGTFEFTPVSGETYNAIIEDEQGKTYTYKLPAALESGYVLSVKDTLDDVITVRVTSKDAPAAMPFVYLFVHARNIVSNATMQFLQQGEAIISVSKKDLQEGISHITVFDPGMQPVCERLYFNRVKRKLSIDIQPSQREFGIRRKVALDITATGPAGEPLPSNLSMAVYKIDSLSQPMGSTILNYLWLASDLQGTIESPDYFMNTEDTQVRKSLDQVMLTHGWRRFNWKDIQGNSAAAIQFVPEFRGHIIHGKVTDVAGNPVRNVMTYLSSPARNIQVYGSVSNANGEVRYEMKDFSGARKIITQTNSRRDSTSLIRIESPFSDKYATWKTSPFTMAKTAEKQLVTRTIGMQVQDIFYQDKFNPVKNNAIDSTAFYGKADATYYLDDYTRFPVMEEVMREYVPGVLVRKRKDGFHFMNLDVVNKTIFDEDPLVLLDGIPIFDINKIIAFDPLKVKKLEVITRRYYLGVLSLPGIVSYTTYTGDLGGFQLDPKTVMLDYEGLQLQREFYSPKYDTPKMRDNRLPDQRSLLYWDPAVVTSRDGKKRVEFYTSDQTGDFQVVVEGLTTGGMSGRGSILFSVRPFDN